METIFLPFAALATIAVAGLCGLIFFELEERWQDFRRRRDQRKRKGSFF